MSRLLSSRSPAPPPCAFPGPTSRAPRRRFPTKIIRPLLVLLLVLVSLPGGVDAAAPGRLELGRQDAVAMAIRRNIDLRVEALNSSIAAKGLAGSHGLYDPVLSSSASHGETSYPGETFRTTSSIGSLALTQYLPTGGSIGISSQAGYSTAESDNSSISSRDWQSAVGLTISQPLLKNFGKTTTELNITLSANNLQDALERFRFSLTDTVFAVITAYNRLYTLHQVLVSQQDALDSAQRLVAELRSQPHPGPLRKVDIANVEYAIAQRRRSLVDAERNLSDQQAHLRYLIGMDEKTLLTPVDAPSRREPQASEKEAVALALESRSDLKEMQITLQSAELQEKVAKQQSWPDLSLNASGGFSGIAGSIGNSYQQIGQGEGGWWSAGLQFNLPLGNTAAENSYQQSRIRTEQARKRVTAYQWKIRDGVATDMRSLISARLQLQTTDQALKYARERYAEYQKHQRSGAGTVQDLLNAENDLISARNSQTSAVESFAYAVALLWRDMGVLLERENIHVDTAHPEAATRPASQTAGPASTMAIAAAAAASAPAPRPKVPETRPEPSPKTPPAPVSSAAESSAAGATAAAAGNAAAPPAPAAATAPAKSPPAASPPPPEAATGVYTLEIGSFVTAAELARVKGVLAAAGLAPVISPGPRVPTPMTRLFNTTFSDYAKAKARLAQLRELGLDPFLLRGKGGSYRVYADSFADPEVAQEQRRRLAAQGFDLTLETAKVPLPSRLVTAGSFTSRAEATAAATRLKAQGLAPRILGSSS